VPSSVTSADDVNLPGPTFVPVATGPSGYRRLVTTPAEPHRIRTDLGGPHPSRDLRPIVAFVQVSDLHITDAQSPGRAEYLDRLADDDSAVVGRVGPVGTYRPQESLTAQVAGAMASAIRRIDTAPVTGAPLSFLVATGDSADNAQTNEVETAIAVAGGGRVTPDSGDQDRWEGVGGTEAYDPRYWHPDGTPAGEEADRPRARFGFPTVPGLLDAARRPWDEPGAGLPWHPVYGNHDNLMGGTVVPTPLLRRLTVGDRKAAGWPAALGVEQLLKDFGDAERANPIVRDTLRSAAWRTVTADPRRGQLDRAAWTAAHDHRSARPAGAPTWYGFDAGLVRGLVLDTVNVNGGWQGSIGADQLAWLESELEAGSSRWVGRDGRLRAADATDRLFVLFSHHPLRSLINPWAPGGEHLALADEVAAVLARFPNLVAWVDGHTHTNTITAYPGHPAIGGGWWEITTASHVDWPQQARIVELAEDPANGTVVIACTIVDHDGLVDPRTGDLGELTTLAGWSRELSANHWQRMGAGLEPHGRGGPADRNVLLVRPSEVTAAAIAAARAKQEHAS
jgi:metallophosphoesterase (TIGR03767 family)